MVVALPKVSGIDSNEMQSVDSWVGAKKSSRKKSFTEWAEIEDAVMASEPSHLSLIRRYKEI
jgi:hypothetical protein